MSDAQKLNRVVQTLFAVLIGNSLQAEAQILPHIEMIEQTGFLKNVPDAAFVGRNKKMLFVILPDLTGDTHVALSLFQTCCTPQYRRLAAARHAEKHRHASARKPQINVQRKTRAA